MFKHARVGRDSAGLRPVSITIIDSSITPETLIADLASLKLPSLFTIVTVISRLIIAPFAISQTTCPRPNLPSRPPHSLSTTSPFLVAQYPPIGAIFQSLSLSTPQPCCPVRVGTTRYGLIWISVPIAYGLFAHVATITSCLFGRDRPISLTAIVASRLKIVSSTRFIHTFRPVVAIS